jgi:hypothetical protein
MHLFSAYLVGRTFSSIPGALPSLGTEPPPLGSTRHIGPGRVTVWSAAVGFTSTRPLAERRA